VEKSWNSTVVVRMVMVKEESVTSGKNSRGEKIKRFKSKEY
jgi:hypothetical protein